MFNTDRRRFVRAQVTDGLNAETAQSGVIVRLVDMSLGGFLAESSTGFVPDTAHLFRFSTEDDQWAVTLRAITVYSHQRGGRSHVSGFAFADKADPAAAQAIFDLFDRVTTRLKRADATLSLHEPA